MQYLWWVIPFLLLMLALNHFGLVRSRTCFLSVGGDWGLASWWRGRYQLLTGYLARNFVIPEKGGALSVEIKTISGQLDLMIQNRRGDILYAWYGPGSVDVQVALPSRSSCRVKLQGVRFQGEFSLSLLNL